MSLPPEDPTRPLPPAGPPPRGVVHDRVVEEDPAWREMLLDRLDSLRTGLVVVGLFAAAALGVALWSLLGDDERDGDRSRGASAERVSALDDRVEALEERAGDLPSKRDVEALADRQEELSKRVDDVSQQAQDDSGPTADEQARDSIEQLNQAVTDLGERVEALEQQQSQPTP